MITPRQFEAARATPWLRAAFHQKDTVEETLADPEVVGDPNTTAGKSGAANLDAPDMLLGGRTGVDVIPDTPASRAAHLDRGYIEGPDQLVTYPVPTAQFLAEIFA
ncbi:hypothetical protein Pen01_39180 [Phytomonospora endophytica]|nr:hypothetical protein Pen01_39180 [Phytomonospora endophytica]